MATSINNSLNLRLLNSMFSRKSKWSGFNTSKNFSLSFKPITDFFSSRSNTQVIQMTVKKMQAAINASASGVTAQFQRTSGSITLLSDQTLTEADAPAPSQWDVDRAVQRAGGEEALSPWLVDGKTKLDINGRKVVASVNGSASNNNTDTAAPDSDPRAAAAKAISRFGLEGSALDGDTTTLRDNLKQTATRLSAENPNLSLAIEYALEDAFAKITAWESAEKGTSAATTSYEDQRETNLKQAASIAAQLNLGDGGAWGINSLAEDLAVFGMDMTALSEDPYGLADKIRDKSKEMLADLEKRYAGTETEFIKERNRITGASARLVNGLEGSGVMIGASASLSGSFSSTRVDVNIGGTRIDANAVIAISNVIVDPLVLDLNGDGIDLKSAEEGVAFDMNGDGQQTQMGFIRGDDALLFVDTHGDGVVHDGRQLFGNTQGHANGFEMLAAHDENGDGVIDENDAIYDQLRLWVEKNEDGVCESDETMSLREAGIKSINLGYQDVREDDGKGNLIGQTGSFTRDDGSSGYAADVWLQEKKA